MFSLIKKHPIGIDIGSDSIKAVKLKGISNNEIDAITRVQINCENQEDVVFESHTAEALKEIAAVRGFSQSPCTSVISDPSVSIVNLRLPPLPEEEIPQADLIEGVNELKFTNINNYQLNIRNLKNAIFRYLLYL